jgi:predicted dehydrogenase
MKKRNETQKSVTRRDFLKRASTVTALAGATWFTAAQARAIIGANERIGVGFIGAGGRSVSHLSSIEALKNDGENVAIVAVADVYRPRAKARVEKYGGTLYADYRELIADPNVDMVAISTPDHHHAQQTIDAVRAKKAVYCEKPVSHWRQFELTKKMAEEVRAAGVPFQLGTQGMSDPAWPRMRQLIQDGLIGNPIHAECGYFRVGDWGEAGMPIDDPKAQPGEDLNWEAFLGDAPKRPFDVSRFFRWRMYEDYAGGPCTDLFPHSLTPVVYMLGLTFPSTVVATGGKFRYEEREVPDTFNILIDYPERVTVAVLGTQGNNHSGVGQRDPGGRVPLLRGWEGTLTVEEDEIVFTPAEGSKKPAQRIAIEGKHSTKNHFKNLIECFRGGRTDTFSPMDLALHVQTALQMAYVGWREGKVARFDRNTLSIVL